MPNMHGGRRTLVLGAVTALIFSACSSAASTAPSIAVPSQAPAGSAGSPASTAPSPSAASLPSCAGLGNVTLTMLDSENTDPEKASVDVPTKAFEQANPNVTVNITYEDLDTVLKTISLKMSSDTPPDLVYGNQGYDPMGTLIKGGLILNLDKYAQAFGWDTEFDPGVIQPNRFSTDGTQFGSGSLWGLSLASEYVAVFYNKTNLAKIGITDATTLDSQQAFEAALAKAQAAGLQPILLGDATQFPGTHNYSLYQSWYVPASTSDDWVYGKAGSTFDDQAHQQAAADYQSWFQKGYYNQDALAVAAPDATTRFGQGTGVFYIDGDWRTGDLSKALGSNVGWMLFPPASDGKHGAVGSVSLPISISSKTKYPDCAAAYLNFITTSDSAKQAMLDNGRIPATGVPANMQASDPLVQQEISEYNRLIADHGLMAWEDWATPTMLNLMGADIQLLLAGKMTPAQYTAAIQADWVKFQSTAK